MIKNYPNLMFSCLTIHCTITQCVFLCRYRKPSKESLLTSSYWQRFAREQESQEDNISIHRGVPDSVAGSREGSKQGSILSRLSGKRRPQEPDHTSLLEAGPGTESEDDEGPMERSGNQDWGGWSIQSDGAVPMA